MYEYQLQQQAFARFIRNPEKNSAPEKIETRRLKIYSDLFFNNIESFLSNTFPVLKSLMPECQWLALSRDFFEKHDCHSPYFLQIPEEFLQYLEDENLAIYQQYPFVGELAHYEWLELALDVAEDEFVEEKQILSNFPAILEQTLTVSPLVCPAVYNWPVHEISVDNVEEVQPQQVSCLIVYRNRQQQVKFLHTNAPTLRLLEIFQTQDGICVSAALIQLAAEMGQADIEALTDFGLDILQQLFSLDIISHFAALPN